MSEFSDNLPPEKKSKKVGELFEDRNANVVTLPRQQ
jgi:hypothetical protein